MVLKRLSSSGSRSDEVKPYQFNSRPDFSKDALPPEPEAGLRSLEHYQRALSPWQFRLRQRILFMIRQETPYLARIQRKVRTSALDSYFAFTANLGTHNFFMLILPILFWCGYTSLGKGLVHILAAGVFITGILKDTLCLPRPLAPPLHRITMSESASLEFGFPSTHSANAISVAIYAVVALRSSENQIEKSMRLLIEVCVYIYVFSITMGRLYCGMHGFIDVIAGGTIGAIVSTFECLYGTRIDRFVYQSSWVAPAFITLFMISLILAHPDPVDECPCFNDTVAFAGVIIGIEAGLWHYANSDWAWNSPALATAPFDLSQMGWAVAILRIIIGTFVIFTWRRAMKFTQLKIRPYLFSVVGTYDSITSQELPKPKLEYKAIFSHLKLESVRNISHNLLDSIRSIRNLDKSCQICVKSQPLAETQESIVSHHVSPRDSFKYDDACRNILFCCSRGISKNLISPHLKIDKQCTSHHLSPRELAIYESSANQLELSQKIESLSPKMSQKKGESSEHKKAQSKGIVVSGLQRRVRCNFELITEIILYMGIGWLAVDFNPIFFEITGLGLSSKTIWPDRLFSQKIFSYEKPQYNIHQRSR